MDLLRRLEPRELEPARAVRDRALPLAGPWMKISEALDYALKLKAKAAFGVHDMILNAALTGFVPQTASAILEPRGVHFCDIELDKEYEF